MEIFLFTSSESSLKLTHTYEKDRKQNSERKMERGSHAQFGKTWF